MAIKRVSIGIQARSTSERFPRKVFELIGGKPMLLHVIGAADRCAFYMNRKSIEKQIEVNFFVLCPHGDEIAQAFNSKARVIEGDEFDVLSRYVSMMNLADADYVVRITGDCPLIPAELITKHIQIATINRYDYLSNVDPEYRTSIDGHDVEVVSRAAMDWLNQNAKEPFHREHVTTLLRTDKAPSYFKVGAVQNSLDQSNRMLSVNTMDDLERVRAEFEMRDSKRKRAIAKYGKENVHQL